MSPLPRVYGKYELIFTPHLIPHLRDLRGKEWRNLVDSLSELPETHPDVLAFSIMMIKLDNCLGCEMDSYRAQRGCASCASQTILSFKGSDQQLMCRYENSKKRMNEQLQTSYPLIQLQAA